MTPAEAEWVRETVCRDIWRHEWRHDLAFPCGPQSWCPTCGSGDHDRCWHGVAVSEGRVRSRRGRSGGWPGRELMPIWHADRICRVHCTCGCPKPLAPVRSPL